MEWDDIWIWLQRIGGVVAAASIAVVVSYRIWLPHLREFVAGWMDRRFRKQMQDADHAFQEKVRHVQSVIDRELDRARKLQDREFEALSKAWETLHEAFWRARKATSRGYQVANLAGMQERELQGFVAGLDFPDWQKEQLLEMVRRPGEALRAQNQYTKWWRAKQYSDCEHWRIQLVQYVDRNGIFMQPEIKARFDRLHQLISDALLEFRLRIEDLDAPVNRFADFVRSEALQVAGEELCVELEGLIRQRIWSPVLTA